MQLLRNIGAIAVRAITIYMLALELIIFIGRFTASDKSLYLDPYYAFLTLPAILCATFTFLTVVIYGMVDRASSKVLAPEIAAIFDEGRYERLRVPVGLLRYRREMLFGTVNGFKAKVYFSIVLGSQMPRGSASSYLAAKFSVVNKFASERIIIVRIPLTTYNLSPYDYDSIREQLIEEIAKMQEKGYSPAEKVLSDKVMTLDRP